MQVNCESCELLVTASCELRVVHFSLTSLSCSRITFIASLGCSCWCTWTKPKWTLKTTSFFSDHNSKGMFYAVCSIIFNHSLNLITKVMVRVSSIELSFGSGTRKSLNRGTCELCV